MGHNSGNLRAVGAALGAASAFASQHLLTLLRVFLSWTAVLAFLGAIVAWALERLGVEAVEEVGVAKVAVRCGWSCLCGRQRDGKSPAHHAGRHLL